MEKGKGDMEFSTIPLMTVLRYGRWRWRRFVAAARYGYDRLASSPVIFGNSFPKSGTHLLVQILLAFPRVGLAVDPGVSPVLTFVPATGERRRPDRILRDLRRFRAGDIGFGHVTADPEIVQAWQNDTLAHFFIIRDLRDVALSHAFYIHDKATTNIHHRYYQSLPDLDSRIRVSITGRPEMGELFPNIQERFDLYAGWLEEPDICLVRFEDLIGDRQKALERILDFAIQRGFRLHLPREQALETLARAIDPRRSFTFRSGQVGEWRRYFTEEHKALFKEIAGDLLIRLGYEKDLLW